MHHKNPNLCRGLQVPTRPGLHYVFELISYYLSSFTQFQTGQPHHWFLDEPALFLPKGLCLLFRWCGLCFPLTPVSLICLLFKVFTQKLLSQSVLPCATLSKISTHTPFSFFLLSIYYCIILHNLCIYLCFHLSP